MSVIRPKPPEEPIEYDPAGVFAVGDVPQDSRNALAGMLEHARRKMLDELACWRHDGSAAERPAGAFLDLPDRLLADYNTSPGLRSPGTGRVASELFAILQTARRIRDTVDRVIVIGGGGAAIGTRVLFETCSHPFHNELSRGDRGGRPKLSCAGFDLDNDSAQGLLDLVAPSGAPRSGDLLDQWAVIVVATTAAGEPAAAAAARLFLQPLSASLGNDRKSLANRVVSISAPAGLLADLATAIGCPDALIVEDGVAGRHAIFTAASLLPAAIVGIDVVRLLTGAAAMHRRFREAPVADNPVLQCVAAWRLAAEHLAAPVRVLSGCGNRLEAVGHWHDQLLSDNLDPVAYGPTPPTAQRPRCLPGSPQQQTNRCDTLITNLVVREPRREPLAVPPSESHSDGNKRPDDLAGATWPGMLAASVAARHASAEQAGKPMADILLPRIDEHAVGQLLQMLLLATVVDRRLAGMV